MPYFTYKVRDKQGRERQSTQEAASEEELISRLQNEDLLVVSVTCEEVERKKRAPQKRLRLRITLDDLVIFIRQLATMLEAGVTLLKSLDVLTKQIESRKLLEVIEDVKHNVASGSTFRDALAKHPQIFSEFWVQIVETGEASGALPASLSQLADYLESSAAMRRKVISALIYPAVLIVIAIAALTVFSVWIVPIFSKVFDTFDTELPFLTVAVINFSNMARRYFLILCALAAALGYIIYRYIHTEKGKLQFDQLKLRLPVLGLLFQRIAIERFANGLGTLIESGVPILYGLDIIAKATGNKVVERATLEVKESVRQGKGMAQPLESSGVFTPMVVQLVSVGEEIGELGKMLKRISGFFKERIDTTLTRLTTLIEPVVLVLMGIVVGILVIALFLPIFELALIERGG